MRIRGRDLQKLIREEVARSMGISKEGLRFEEIIDEEGLRFEEIIDEDEDIERAITKDLRKPTPTPKVLSDEEQKEAIAEIVRAYRGQINAAWQQITKADPDANGVFVASWKITKGVVSNVKIVKNTIPHPGEHDEWAEAPRKSFGERVLRGINTWQFPPAITNEIEYEWRFRP